MGPVRHQKLIRLLAFVVALDLFVGVGVLYVRGGPASAAGPTARTPRAGGQSPDAAALGIGAAPGEILSGIKFSKRRAAETGSTAPGTSGPAGRPPAPAGTGSSSSTSPRPAPTAGSSTSAPRAPAPTTGPAPTTSTRPLPTASTAPAAPPPGSTGPAGGGTAAPRRFTWVPLDDPAGDPVVDGTDRRKAENRVDIVRARVAYTPSLIVLNLETAQNTDPASDPQWRSPSTFQSWELDVDGDGKADFDVQYLFDGETVAAGVSRVGDGETDSVCEAEARYWSGGYAVGFDPACVGSPASFSYRAKMYFDTDPADADADVLTDTAPDGGLSRPVARQAE